MKHSRSMFGNLTSKVKSNAPKATGGTTPSAKS
jgi:hypothetical protein